MDNMFERYNRTSRSFDFMRISVRIIFIRCYGMYKMQTPGSMCDGRRWRISKRRQIHQHSRVPLQRLLCVPTRVSKLRTNRVYEILVLTHAHSHLGAVVVRLSVKLQLVPDRFIVLDHSEGLQKLQHPVVREKH